MVPSGKKTGWRGGSEFSTQCVCVSMLKNNEGWPGKTLTCVFFVCESGSRFLEQMVIPKSFRQFLGPSQVHKVLGGFMVCFFSMHGTANVDMIPPVNPQEAHMYNSQSHAECIHICVYA